MLAGTDSDHVDMRDILDGLADIGNHAEHTDRSGKGGGVGVDLITVVGDPVAAGSGIVPIGCDHRLVLHEELDAGLDLLGGEHAAAGRVHAENDRLDGGVGTDLGNDAGEIISGNILLAFSLDDIAVGIEDRYLFLRLCVGHDLGGDVFGEGE